MRLLLIFFVGMFSFFYLGELLARVFKKPMHSIPGLIMILAGIVLAFTGHLFLAPPLDILITLFLFGAGIGLTSHHLLSQSYLLSERIELDFVRKHETFFERMLEMLPGILTWVALTSPLWLSFTLPFAVAYLIIVAQIYWLINALKIAVLIYLGYKKMDWARRQPWQSLLRTDFDGQWEDYYHLILLPTYKEDIRVLQPAFDAIAESNFPKERIFLAVGFEERDNPDKIKNTTEYLKKFSEKIGGVFISIHPAGLPGEIAGAGSNKNWMIKNAAKELHKRKIDPKKVMATTLDADFVSTKSF